MSKSHTTSTPGEMPVDRKKGLVSGTLRAEQSGELKLVSNPQVEPARVATGVETGAEAAAPADARPGAEPAAPAAGAPAGGATRANVAAEDRSGATGRRGLPGWLLVLIFALLLIALGWQYRVAGALEREIVVLQADLTDARSLLAAHRMRLSEIRGGVHALSEQIEELRSLVDATPGDPPRPTSPSASEPTSSIPARLPER